MALEPRQAVDVAGHGDALTIGKIVAVAAQAGDGEVAVLAIGAGIGVGAVDDPVSSSRAPPRRWRYCCANSGPCEAATPPRTPAAEGGDADDA